MNIATSLLKPKSVFVNYNFLLLFSGKVISILGDQIYAFSLSWYVLEKTKSSIAQSLLLVIGYLIGALVSPLGGIFADRFARKKILVWMDIVRGGIVIIAAILVYLQMMEIWMIYVSVIIEAVCGSIFSPTASAIIPNIVEENQLTQATSMDYFVGSFCTIIGMVISGILYTLIGVAAIFLLNAISFFISGFLEGLLKIPSVKQTDSEKKNSSIYQELRQVIKSLHEGYQYVKTNKLIYKLTFMYAVYFFVGYPLGLVYVPYTFNVILEALPLQYSLALGANFLGALIGSMIAPRLLNRYKLRSSIFWGILIFSVGYLIVAALVFTPLKGYFDNWEITILWAIISIVIGIGMAFFNIPTQVIFQKHTSDEYRGRFWGLQSSIINFSIGMGFLVGGILAKYVWMGFLFAGSSLALIAIDLWAVNMKEIKEFKN
ncbi:MAG TPA: MFS transporter [Bacillota bacterium]|nr:MFS transporter [Bacillota bacterium]